MSRCTKQAGHDCRLKKKSLWHAVPYLFPTSNSFSFSLVVSFSRLFICVSVSVSLCFAVKSLSIDACCLDLAVIVWGLVFLRCFVATNNFVPCQHVVMVSVWNPLSPRISPFLKEKQLKYQPLSIFYDWRLLERSYDTHILAIVNAVAWTKILVKIVKLSF